MFFIFSLLSLVLASVQDLRKGVVYDFTWILLGIPCLNSLLTNGFAQVAVLEAGVAAVLLSIVAGSVFKDYLGGADWFAYLALLLGLPFQQWLTMNLILGLYFNLYAWYVKLYRKNNDELYVVHLFLMTLLTTKLFYLLFL